LKIPIELEDITGDRIEFYFNEYRIEISFSTTAWTYTNRLRIWKRWGRGEADISFWMHHSMLKEILTKFFNEKERDKLWVALRIGASLSWSSSARCFLRACLEYNWNKMFKSAYYSLLSKRSAYYFDENYELRKWEIIMEAIKEGLEKGYFKRNKWVRKLEKVKEYLKWRRILGKKNRY